MRHTIETRAIQHSGETILSREGDSGLDVARGDGGSAGMTPKAPSGFGGMGRAVFAAPNL